MTITVGNIITLGAVLGVLTTLIALIFKFFRWMEAQQKQDEDIKNIKKEMTLICYCTSATLDGLQQLGANHTVPVAKDKLDKYINNKAHDQE